MRLSPYCLAELGGSTRFEAWLPDLVTADLLA